MKFRDVGDRIVGRKDCQRSSEHQARPSPLLDKNTTIYTQTMRDCIKNSFTEKLALFQNGTNLYNFQQKPNALKATSHLLGVPSLLPPETSFEVADLLRQGSLLQRRAQYKENQLPSLHCGSEQPKRSSLQSHFSSVYEPVDHKFRHRTGLKELEGWLRKKLENPPKSQADCVEYKNQIMWLGMKELIRMVRLRCQNQGNLIEEIWEQTWKICRDVILFLSKSMATLRQGFNDQLQIIEKLYESKLREDGAHTSKFTTRIQDLESQLKSANEQLKTTNRMNRELKVQVNDQRSSKESFEAAYMRVLEDNIVLQAGNVEKREWVKKLYKSVKQYKTKVASKMKSAIRDIATERAACDGEQLDLEGIELENIELEELLGTNQPPVKEYENAMVSTEPVECLDCCFQTEQVVVDKRQQETMTDEPQAPAAVVVQEDPIEPTITVHSPRQEAPNPPKEDAAVYTELTLAMISKMEAALIVNIVDASEGAREQSVSSVAELARGQEPVMKQTQSKGFETVEENEYEEGPTDREQPKAKQVSRRSLNEPQLPTVIQKASSLNNRQRRNSRLPRKSMMVAPVKKISERELLVEDKKKPKDRIDTEMESIDLDKMLRQPLRKVNTSRDSFGSPFPKNAVNPASSDKRTLNVPKLERTSFNETYKYMRKFLNHNRRSFLNSVSRRRSFVRLETVQREEQCLQDYELYSQRLALKFEKTNFNQLSKIKSNKNELATFKDLLKSCSTVQLQTEKNMQAAIEKHVVPVLMDEIKSYRKIRSAAGFNSVAMGEFVRQLSPFPLVVLRKFNQKYGVKTLALKNLRQILRYAQAMRGRTPREQIIYQLLFTEPFTSCDAFLLYMNIEIFLDPSLSSLSSYESNFKRIDPEEVSEQLIDELLGNVPIRHQFRELKQEIDAGMDINQLSLRLLSGMTAHRYDTLQKFNGLFDVLTYQSTSLKFADWSAFVCSLDLEASLQRSLLRAFLSLCNIRTNQNKYELTEDKFYTIIMRSDFLRWEVIEASFKRFAACFDGGVDREKLLDYALRQQCNSRLLRIVEGLLESPQPLSPAKQSTLQFAWTYMQYLCCRSKHFLVQRQILGQLHLLTLKELLAGSHNNRELFDIQYAH